MGLNNFVWWFGVVEDRLDPLNIGRCRVRCFGWHTDKKSDITTEDLPWAHPVVPYGNAAVQPPPEGTMVFGFFADGKEGRYPILMGTVPGIPEEQTSSFAGFSDPYSIIDKAFSANPVFPRRVANSSISTNNKGPVINNDFAKRYPSRLNEPTVSRLARPDRVESANTGAAFGVRSASIEGTAIDFQRKNRVIKIRSARFEEKKDPLDPSGKKKVRYYTVWNEPFPSYNAKYPFNHVTETESGHAFEMDDTPEYERVQLSHRTGSTLEFLPSGSIKEKAFKDKYSIVMGNHRTYINGAKDETVSSDMYLKINGELVIQCNGLRLDSAGDINIKGSSVRISADKNLELYGKAKTNVYGAGRLNLRSEGNLGAYGGISATYGSGGLTAVTASPNPISAAVKTLLKSVGVEVEGSASELNSGVKIVGPNFWSNALLSTHNNLITNILPPTAFDPLVQTSARAANPYKAPPPKILKTVASFRRENTDSLAYFEKSKVELKG